MEYVVPCRKLVPELIEYACSVHGLIVIVPLLFLGFNRRGRRNNTPRFLNFKTWNTREAFFLGLDSDSRQSVEKPPCMRTLNVSCWPSMKFSRTAILFTEFEIFGWKLKRLFTACLHGDEHPFHYFTLAVY
jgi:hypothetical protein